MRNESAVRVERLKSRGIVPGLAVVIVGDRKAIESGIKALNLGPITIVPTADILK